MTEAAETVLEVFIPGPGENPEDPQDMERSIFLGAALIFSARLAHGRILSSRSG